MLGWLRDRAAEAETVTAVCTGSMLLGFAGLLDGLHATTHWRSLDWMRDSFPSVTVEYDKHFVEDGRVFTSAGISAGFFRYDAMNRQVVVDAADAAGSLGTAGHELTYDKNGNRKSDRTTHGIPISRKRCSPNSTLAKCVEGLTYTPNWKHPRKRARRRRRRRAEDTARKLTLATGSNGSIPLKNFFSRMLRFLRRASIHGRIGR